MPAACNDSLCSQASCPAHASAGPVPGRGRGAACPPALLGAAGPVAVDGGCRAAPATPSCQRVLECILALPLMQPLCEEAVEPEVLPGYRSLIHQHIALPDIRAKAVAGAYALAAPAPPATAVAVAGSASAVEQLGGVQAMLADVALLIRNTKA